MSNAPEHQQHDIQDAVQAQQDEARMHAHLAQYSRALHDYTLALWTESRRVAQEKERVMRERQPTVHVSAGLPASGSQSRPTPSHSQATLAANAPTTLLTQSAVDDITPKAVTPPKSNPVDSAQKTPTPSPASS